MKQRLEYIDTFRGLCIFAVVYGHIVLFGTNGGYVQTPVDAFMRVYFLVGFFFLSGLMAYKEGMLVNASDLWSLAQKKVRTLLIPSIVVNAIYTYWVTDSISAMLCPWNLWVTWFTYVLFFISIIYGVLLYVVQKAANTDVTQGSIVLVAVASYLFSRTYGGSEYYDNVFRLGGLIYYLPFFFIGVLVKMHFDRFNMLMDKGYVQFAIFGVMALSFAIHSAPLIVRSLSTILFMYSLSKNMSKMNTPSIAQKWLMDMLGFLGKYSLEIYFVHFFLLFNLPICYTEYMKLLATDSCWYGHSSAGTVELIVVGTLSLLLAFASVFIANLLKTIPFVGILMFGRK